MPWRTHGSGCGGKRQGEGGAPEPLELARVERGRSPGNHRGCRAATTRADDGVGPAVLPAPDGGARVVPARVLRDRRHRRTRRGAVRPLLPDRHRAPQSAAVRAVPARHRPVQPGRVEPARVRGARLARHRSRGDARRRDGRHGGGRGRGLFPKLGGHHAHAARRRGPRDAPHFCLADGRGAVGAHRLVGARAPDRTHRVVRDQPARARGSAQSARARVRRRGAGAGRRRGTRYFSPRSSQCGGPDHRVGGPRHRPHDAARSRALVPRAGRSLPDAQLGQYDCRRLAQDGRRVVVVDLSRAGDLARRDGAERGGRRAARRARPPQGGGVTEPLLRVRDLKTYFVTEHGSGTARAVDGVSFEVLPGETLGIVGESGCGKTVTSLSILRLIPEPPGHIRAGSVIEFEGRNLLTLKPRELIAMALVCHPKLLIADEPTTALDVTIQAQILELLDRLQAELGMAVMLITHDLGVVAGSADRVVVMYAGQVVEQAPTAALFARPLHPYTEGLLASVPRLDAAPAREHGRLHGIPGQVPAATAWPDGCRFHPRCPYAWDRCRAEAPPLLDAGGGGEPGTHTVRCWLLTDPRRRTLHL